ncbi:MAG: transcription antitermination factor NusB [Anaeroplasmataceae bacterium]
MYNLNRDERMIVIATLYNIDFINVGEKVSKESLEIFIRLIAEMNPSLYSINNIVDFNEFISTLEKLIDQISIIDQIIVDNLNNYTINRLNIVDKQIIRLAIFEMKSGLKYQLAINEALEITNIYTDLGDKKSKAFNNKLLDEIRKKIVE